LGPLNDWLHDIALQLRVFDDAGLSVVTAVYFNCTLEMSNPIKMRIQCEFLTKAADKKYG